MSATGSGEQRARDALAATAVPHTITRHGPVNSLAEAAAARGVEPGAIVKTLVVRRADDDFVLVLVPGDRAISWPKLRERLGVNRLSMPDAATAQAATGYERGTITPFGAHGDWPVVADERLAPMAALSIGAGAHGVAAVLSGADLLTALTALPGGVEVADVTEPL